MNSVYNIKADNNKKQYADLFLIKSVDRKFKLKNNFSKNHDNNNSHSSFNFNTPILSRVPSPKINNKIEITGLAHTHSRSNSDNLSYNNKVNYKSKTKRIVVSECSNNCKNSKILLECHTKINKLLEANSNIKKINEYLVILIENKDNVLSKLMKENHNLKSELSSLEKILKKIYSDNNIKNEINDNSPRYVSIEPSTDDIKSTKKSGINSPSKSYDKNLGIRTQINRRMSSSSIGTNDMLTAIGNNKEKNKNIENFNNNKFKRLNSIFFKSGKIKDILANKASSHYDKISDLGVRFLNRKNKGEIRIKTSFLAMDNESINRLISNDPMKELYDITLSDDLFIETMKFSSEEKLLTYCDIIGNAIKDYQCCLNLISRIKSFFKANVNLVDSVLSDDCTLCLIKNACDILSCERTSIFVFDNYSNMLVVNSGEGIKKSELKVPIDRGIVGACFVSGKRIIVDDPYNDERFNKEVDRKLGFKTRNILCMPLIDKDGVIYGVIQSINKKTPSMAGFNRDDEELMEIFSLQATSILKNSMNSNDNFQYISRMKHIIDYNIKLDGVKMLHELTQLAEDVLMAIFNTNSVQFIICSETDSLYHYRQHHIEKKKNLGIIYHVYQEKKFFKCYSNYGCDFYNILTDIDTDSLLVTFPILNLNYNENDYNNSDYIKNNDIVYAVAQLTYTGKHLLSSININLKDSETNIINFFIKVTSIWFKNFHMKSI